MTDPLDLDRLVELAEAATPGPWEHYTDQLRPGSKVTVNEVQVADAPPIVQWMGFDDSTRPKAQHTANAAYIAAVSPSTVLALVREVREARARRSVDQLTEMHRAHIVKGCPWCIALATTDKP